MNVKSLGTVLILCLLMAGCGGGGGGSSDPRPAIVSGQAVKGAIAGGTVTAYAIAAGVPGNVLATAITDADGNYSLTIEGYSGPVLLEITGGSFIDEATGAAIDLPGSSGSGLRAAVGNVTAAGDLQVQITPLTTFAAARAAQMTDGLTASNIDAANQQLSAYFGGIDLLAMSPIDPTVAGASAGASQAAVDYGLILGGLSQLADLLGVDPLTLVTALAEDIGDGDFDGAYGGAAVIAGGDPLPADTGGADLAAAIGTFSAGSANLAGGTASPALLALLANGGPQPSGAVVEIKAGIAYVCARFGSGAVKCWGMNNHVLLGNGQLGLGDVEHRGDEPGEMGDNLPALDLGSGRSAARIAVGSSHACALLDNGSVKCWGVNTYGQLGLGNTETRGDDPNEMGDDLPAIDLGIGRTATLIAAGGFHTCAILDDGALKCWGANESGQLGLGDVNHRGDAPNEMGGNLAAVDLGDGRTAVDVVLGAAHTCALLDNATVKCWGFGGFGQLGLGDASTRGDAPNEMGDNLPAVDLGTGRTAVQIAANASGLQTCAVLDDGSAKCWGMNSNQFVGAGGILGLGDNENRGDEPGEMGDNLPAIDLGAGRTAVRMELGRYHTCALLDNGTVKCWGWNVVGQLGLGDIVNRGENPGEMGDNLPALDFGTGRTVVSIAAGETANCALLDNATVKCWGGNGAGALGLGDAVSRGDDPGEMGDNLPVVDLGS